MSFPPAFARHMWWIDSLFGSGDRIRTGGLRVMSPTSYLPALPRIIGDLLFPNVGFGRDHEKWLNCIPIVVPCDVSILLLLINVGPQLFAAVLLPSFSASRNGFPTPACSSYVSRVATSHWIPVFVTGSIILVPLSFAAVIDSLTHSGREWT